MSTSIVMPIKPEHLEKLRASAISDFVMQARLYSSILAQDESQYGFKYLQSLSGLLIPLWGIDGTIKGYQLRPDNPRLSKKGKRIKYETPRNQPNILDLNPLMQGAIRKGRAGIWITEGSLKGDALASAGFPAISLSGVWNWRGRNEDGGYTTLPDWEEVSMRGSRFVIVFDSDIATNHLVADSARRLKQWLLYKKADLVRILLLPQNGDEKTGVDDYLASIPKG